MARQEQYYSIYSALYKMHEYYEIEMDREQFESLAMDAYEKIGNKVTRPYIQEYTIKDEKITKPAGIKDIVSVTLSNGELDLEKDIVTTDTSGSTITYANNNRFLSPGQTIDFIDDMSNTLYFNKEYNNCDIYLSYTIESTDADGFPSITRKEAEAIFNYCLMVWSFKKFIKTNDKKAGDMYSKFEADWNKTCDQARVPDYIDDNVMDQLGDVTSRWDRKRYKRTYKTKI